jgi:hypothetical protein
MEAGLSRIGSKRFVCGLADIAVFPVAQSGNDLQRFQSPTHFSLKPCTHTVDGSLDRVERRSHGRSLSTRQVSDCGDRRSHVTVVVLRSILASISTNSLQDTGRRTLLALKIAAAFRIRELSRLRVSHMGHSEDKLEVRLFRTNLTGSAHRRVVTCFDDPMV